MDESEAFAIATQQAHALGKSPEGYGTSSGRTAAKRKYRTPQDDQKTASAFMWDAFFSELEKVAAFMPPLSSVAKPVASSAAAAVKGFKPSAIPKPASLLGSGTSTAIRGKAATGMASGASPVLKPATPATPAIGLGHGVSGTSGTPVQVTSSMRPPASGSGARAA